MTVKIALVLNGDPPTAADWAAIAGVDAVICADGGADYAFAAGVPVHAVVGDMDSLRGELPDDVESHRYPGAKDETDGELALLHALGMGPDEIVIIGGHGGRTALLMANLKLVRRAQEAGVPAVMVGQGERLWFVMEGQRVDLGPVGHVINVLPTDGAARMSLSGTAWELDNLTLEQTTARGVSNVIEREEARLEVHAGRVLVIIEDPRADAPPPATPGAAA